MTSNSILTKDHASVPGAVPAFQRSPSSNIAYRRRQEFLDRLRGRRSRSEILDAVSTEDPAIFALATPWLQALSDECRGHLEGERRATNAMLATLDHSLAAAYQRLASLLERRGHLADAREQIAAASPVPDPRGVAADGNDIALARATRHQHSRLATVTAEVAALDEQTAELHLEIATLLEDRASQWKLLLTRAAQIIAHFDCRAATRADEVARRAKKTRIAPTRCERPEWLTAAPPAPPTPPFPGDPTTPTN